KLMEVEYTTHETEYLECNNNPEIFQLFFCQAEDGIRDRNVTGVQTCALPISSNRVLSMVAWEARVMSQHSVKIMTKAAQIRTGVPVSRSMKKGKNSTAPASEPMIMMTRPPNRSESHPAVG